MIDLNSYFKASSETPLECFDDALQQALEQRFFGRPHGDLQFWVNTLEALPDLTPAPVDYQQPAVTIGTAEQVNKIQRQELIDALKMLHPWRKGPFNLFGIEIDTEWRSNLKWERVAKHIQPLTGKYVLDVGCGNGYYGWRMLTQQPALVLGVDPSQKFMMQFSIFKKYTPQAPLYYLPLRGEDLPRRMHAFDTVFSMGVLYHRRSPFDHLEELKDALVSGGELVLETLVIEGGTNEVLVPEQRYAQMPNVWFIPSCDTLCAWLQRAGFDDCRIVDISQTGMDEQRSTEWMQFQSLPDYLDPNNHNLTVEGYPAPRRAVVIARKP